MSVIVTVLLKPSTTLQSVLGVANIFFAPQSANPQRKLNLFTPHPQGPQV